MTHWFPMVFNAQGAVASIDFHPSGEQLLSAGEDGVRLWNLREGRFMHEARLLFMGEITKTSPVLCKDKKIEKLN